MTINPSQPSGEKVPVDKPRVSTRSSAFGDYFDVRELLPPCQSILFMAAGPMKPNRLRLLLSHQVYRRDVEALKAQGYTYFTVCPVDTAHWVDLELDPADQEVQP